MSLICYWPWFRTWRVGSCGRWPGSWSGACGTGGHTSPRYCHYSSAWYSSSGTAKTKRDSSDTSETKRLSDIHVTVNLAWQSLCPCFSVNVIHLLPCWGFCWDWRQQCTDTAVSKWSTAKAARDYVSSVSLADRISRLAARYARSRPSRTSVQSVVPHHLLPHPLCTLWFPTQKKHHLTNRWTFSHGNPRDGCYENSAGGTGLNSWKILTQWHKA